jgi:hypothetical protein
MRRQEGTHVCKCKCTISTCLGAVSETSVARQQNHLPDNLVHARHEMGSVDVFGGHYGVVWRVLFAGISARSVITLTSFSQKNRRTSAVPGHHPKITMIIVHRVRLVLLAIVFIVMTSVQPPAGNGQPIQRTFSADNEYHPRRSPDGTKIAFGSNRSGNVDIWSITLGDRTLERLTTNVAYDSHANWSPDGSKIAFASQRSGNFDVCVIEVESVPVENHAWGRIKAKYR